MREQPIPVPTSLACAECGCALSGANSFSLSVPLNQNHIRPADFCSIGCLLDWAIDEHEQRLDGFRRDL